MEPVAGYCGLITTDARAVTSQNAYPNIWTEHKSRVSPFIYTFNLSVIVGVVSFAKLF